MASFSKRNVVKIIYLKGYMKKIYIEALGCPKSIVDSEEIAGYFAKDGFVVTENPEEAEIVVINTCGFIEPAREESIETILKLAEYKNSGRCKKLIVTGCFVQKSEKELKENLPEVDYFFNLDNINEIRKIIDPNLNFSLTERNLLTPSHYAYLKISEGCNNNCSYCTIPAIRGKLKSKPMEQLQDEALKLAKKGVKELIIIAQDIGNYGIDIYKKKMLVPFLKRLLNLDRFKWIRLMYLNPQNITEDIARLTSENKEICNYLDLPIQHASDKILKKMNRKTSRSQIERRIEMLRDINTDLVLRTSIITGFPGETQDDFEEIIEFLREIKFTRLGAFKYYREEGTPAADFDKQITEEIKLERYNRIMHVQQNISQIKLSKFVNKKLNVIIDRKINDSVFECRTEYDAPEIDGIVFLEDVKNSELQVGDFVKVRIIDNLEYDLIAKEI